MSFLQANIFDFSVNDLPVVLTVLLTIIAYNSYWFIAESPKVKQYFYNTYEEEKASILYVQLHKYIGFFFLGIVPSIICLLVLKGHPHNYGLNIENTFQSLLWIFGLACIIVPLNSKASKRPENLAVYPMMRVALWDKLVIIKNVISTIAYLFAYELLFRGILFFTCVATLGTWQAMAINIALYSAVHLPKGPAETIGAIPFGLVICLITLSTGTIWVAVVIHCILALSNDFLSVYYQPNMRYKLNKQT